MSSALKLRVITAVILMAVLILIATQLSPFLFAMFVAFVVLLAAWEWAAFLDLESRRERLPYMASIAASLGVTSLFIGVIPEAASVGSVKVAAISALGLLFWSFAFLILRGYPDNATAWSQRSKIAFMGLCAMVPTWTGIVQLKYIMPEGYLVLALIIMVAAVDVGAFFVGTFFGHTKLAPQLSPNKSWEGVWGGLATCIVLGVIFAVLMHFYIMPLTPVQFLILFLLSILVSFFGVIGDLLESMLKRNCDVKDSGAILPGHGGLLDRVDSLMAVTPVFVLIVLFALAGLSEQ
jgi:phosphatidate cytidylyltransferase